MIIRRFMITCDVPGSGSCPSVFEWRCAGEPSWAEIRAAARLAEWKCEPDGDVCPQHRAAPVVHQTGVTSPG